MFYLMSLDVLLTLTGHPAQLVFYKMHPVLILPLSIIFLICGNAK